MPHARRAPTGTPRPVHGRDRRAKARAGRRRATRLPAGAQRSARQPRTRAERRSRSRRQQGAGTRRGRARHGPDRRADRRGQHPAGRGHEAACLAPRGRWPPQPACGRRRPRAKGGRGDESRRLPVGPCGITRGKRDNPAGDARARTARVAIFATQTLNKLRSFCDVAGQRVRGLPLSRTQRVRAALPRDRRVYLARHFPFQCGADPSGPRDRQDDGPGVAFSSA